MSELIDLLSDDEGNPVAAASSNGNAACASFIANAVNLDSVTSADNKHADDDDVILVDKAPKRANRLGTEIMQIIENPYAKKRRSKEVVLINKGKGDNEKKQKRQNKDASLQQKELQSGLVFEEDVDHIQQSRVASGKVSSKEKSSSPLKGTEDQYEHTEEEDPSSAQEYANHQYATRILHHLPPILYHDACFTAGCPGAIDGIHKVSDKKSTNKRFDDENSALSFNPPKCRCRPPILCTLDYSTRDGPNFGRPFHKCCRKMNGCGHFSWAFTSYMIQWYRFGPHNGHAIVNSGGFKAEDLVQGKVGDCWFLSALAVVAEREDLISRLIGSNAICNNKGKKEGKDQLLPSECGVIEVTLFEDGWWKKFVLDDFLPCFIDQRSEQMEKQQLQEAVQQSLADAGLVGKTSLAQYAKNQRRVTSKFDPNSIPDGNYKTLTEVRDFLQNDQYKKNPTFRSSRSNFLSQSLEPLSRKPTTFDLAYSKARHNQLWVPFIEKAYAKMHGSYKSISGGHVAEAFLDLTGAPTLVYNFDHHNFNPRKFWSDLMSFRKKKLPMGCGTSNSAAGIIGMHAYSILDVREVKNIGMNFFRDKLIQGTLGNVSGFTELDGTLRLLRIRNPHGKGEWKGDFSDKSPVWQSLLANKSDGGADSNGVFDLTAPQSPELKRTMKDDGVFWIDYDSFLMGFHNVDVVLAFEGNHAKSFGSNFAPKTSTHRCTRAFELSVVPRQPGEDGGNNKVEVYVMGIQKTRRGATHGRADRKKSYKASDLGILVGECNSAEGPVQLDYVDGYFFGLTRNGHIRLVLDRSQNKRLIIMPLSFGHPAATDEERSFVVRFCADSPLLVSEMAEPPMMNTAIQKYCFGEKVVAFGQVGTSFHRGSQGQTTVLMEAKSDYSFLFKVVQVDCLSGGGGTVLLYLLVNDELYLNMSSRQSKSISFSIEINCRGMVCRTASGLQQHETISKGEKFKAAWRRFSLSFVSERRSRLLAAVVQGGQDYHLGSVKAEPIENEDRFGPMEKFVGLNQDASLKKEKDKYASYHDFGMFSTVATNSILLAKMTQLRGNTQEDPELTLALKKSRQDFDSKSPIDLRDDDDHSIDAVIMASIIDQQQAHTSNSKYTDAYYDEDLKKAIELSLQHK